LNSSKFTRRVVRGSIAVTLVATIVPTIAQGSVSAQPSRAAGHYIVRAKSADDLVALKSQLQSSGAKIDDDLSQINAVAVSVDSSTATTLASSPHVASLATNGVRTLIDPEGTSTLKAPSLDRVRVAPADPASSLSGLMWNLDRIEAPRANAITMGSGVTVGVADTGLDFTHSELAGQIAGQQDFTTSICTDLFGASDADFAALYGGPAATDWNGHGSWIGGNIAAALDNVGINGIAPKVKLFTLKIAEWCGYAYDSSILDAFKYAADNGIDVVSISFGGYLDRSDPAQEATYQDYVDTVAYARSKGTLIVAAGGNEHLRIGDGGKVISHGPLTIPGDPFLDYYGLYETPGGIPGVVMVSSTNNVTMGASATCAPDGNTGNATCKPASDTHQPIGVGRQDQLTYYSNYGPRVDIAAPGGARKFNLPNADRGGTGGFPYTIADGTTAFEEFSITSNWALEIPCFVNLGPQFYPNECYSTIQGTSMATPHVSAVAALVASSDSRARHNPARILNRLRQGAREAHNLTPPLSATDTSAGDRTGLACPTGFCHLGGRPISDREAYGAGIVDAFGALHN
jgi:subtilisin family serine protease